MVEKNRFVFGIILAVLLLFGVFFIFKNVSSTGNVVTAKYNLENFVDCLNKKNVFIYGLQNDTAVQMQLVAFEGYAKNVTVIDCSVDLEKCKGIVLYPTWNVNDVIIHGSLSLNILSSLSGCPLN